MASTKSTASTTDTISVGDFVKIYGKGIALVKQQVCRDGAVMYIVQVCGCDFDVEIDAKRVQTVTADYSLIAIVKPSRRQAARTGLRLSQIRR